jgi:hypothetical protein
MAQSVQQLAQPVQSSFGSEEIGAGGEGGRELFSGRLALAQPQMSKPRQIMAKPRPCLTRSPLSQGQPHSALAKPLHTEAEAPRPLG